MSITVETAKEHAKDPAVVCCRTEEGTTIEAANLEDPTIFPDLVDSGLLSLDGALTVGQVLNGSKLTKTIDSLTPLTADILDKYDEAEEEKEEEVVAEAAPVAAPAAAPAASVGGTIKLHIGEGKDINIELPTGLGGGQAVMAEVPAGATVEAGAVAPAVQAEKVVGELARRHFKIDKVERGPETKIEGTTLYIRDGIEKEAADSQELVKSIGIEIITPDKYHTYTETILDVQPIACKEDGAELGHGITRVIDGTMMMLSGTDENGVQIGEFGSSEGYIDENMMWGRPGALDKGETVIKTNIVIAAGKGMERPGPIAAHKATDYITDEIRKALLAFDEKEAVNLEEFKQIRRPGKKKVVIVKEIMGQGAMHDNFLFPQQPVGVLGAKPNVDMGNVPVAATPLEVLDGCIHALTCIGPASKEMSRHYWREPLVIAALHDPELDLCGVIFIGSPQVNSEKFYVSNRLGAMVSQLDVDGAFVTTEGFGNNHIDFVAHIENIGKLGVPVVGCSFCAVQGALVAGNPYCNAMVDLNKTEAGIENEILENNTLCPEDAARAVSMLKAEMAGEEIKKSERKYNVNVKLNNIELMEDVLGKKFELVENEESLPMSDKRREKYS